MCRCKQCVFWSLEHNECMYHETDDGTCKHFEIDY